MKKLNNRLFQDMELKTSELIRVIGGETMNTGVGSDTNVSGGGYDISFDTLNDSGESTGVDTVNTSPKGSTKDKPGCETITIGY